MHQDWTTPTSFSEWAKRIFSILNFFVVFISIVFIFSEFRFDWVEHLVGRYLLSTNSERPQTGAIWEAGRHAENAHAVINQLMDEKEEAKQSALQSDSFFTLAQGLTQGDWVNLSKEQFRNLYLALDNVTARELIEPSQLVWLLKGNYLDRIFCERVADGMRIYFLDSENRVIQRVDFRTDQTRNSRSGLREKEGRLDLIDGFIGRIYPSELFFDSLLKLPRDILPDLISSPELLLAQNGQITRVGIGNESINGYIHLGFEFENASGFTVVFIKGREWAVWQLSLSLKGGGI